MAKNVAVDEGRKRDTRAALLGAGLELLSEPSLSSITIDQFVQRAKVAKGSFYNHFASREEFEVLVFERARGRMVAHARKVAGDATDAAVRLARSVCGTISFARDCPGEARMLVRWVYMYQPAIEGIARSVFDDVRAGVLDGRFTIPSVEAGALLAFGLGRALLLQALSGPDVRSMLTMAQETIFLLLRGMGIGADESLRIACQTVELLLRPAERRDLTPHGVEGP